MITQLELISAILNAVSKYGPKNITVRQMNSIISAANLVCEALGIEDTKATVGMGLVAWLASDDTGASSRYMAAVIWGGKAPLSEPSDPADFGRCYRLIRAVEGTKGAMHLLSDKSEYWKLLVNEWNTLEALYEFQLNDKTPSKSKSKTYPLYDRMCELQAIANGVTNAQAR